MSRSSGSYKVVYTQTAVRDIEDLDIVSKKRLGKKIEFFSKKPFFYARKLIKPCLGTYRWRIGDYRVVFDVHGENIVVLRIGHRKEIYR